MSPIHKLFEFAQEYLKRQPFDIVHDFEHHQLVFNNTQEIIQHEQLNPDRQVIEVSAWWHDVEKSYATNNSSDSTIAFFRQTATELEVNPKFVQDCVDVISQHSFSEEQTFLGSKILFDADKIEYVNADRLNKLIESVKTQPERYTAKGIQNTIDIWRTRIKVVRDRMHFDYSKHEFDKKIDSTWKCLETLESFLRDQF